MFRGIRTACLGAALAGSVAAQLPQVFLGNTPTNLHADFGGVFWAPGTAPGEFYVLARFANTPPDLFAFDAFGWISHPVMQTYHPGGWIEVQFHFPEWAYLSGGPCALQPAAGNVVPHGGIDSTTDFGPPLATGPVTGVHVPLPGWVHGTSSRFVGGHPTTAVFGETFALFLRDYFGNPLTACQGGAPVDWVAVRIRIALVQH